MPLPYPYSNIEQYDIVRLSIQTNSSRRTQELFHEIHPNIYELFWNYLQGAFLKTLPCCYLYLFLGSYATQHHLFLTKMAPFMHGLNVIWILIGVLQLFYSTHLQVFILDFIVGGILYQLPWNRCTENKYLMPIGNGSVMINVSCLTLEQYIDKNENKSLSAFDKYLFDPVTKEYFQISHFFNVIFRPTLRKTVVCGISAALIYNNIIWISSSLLCKQLFNRIIWMILHIAHWLLAIFYAIVLLYLYYFAATNVDITSTTLQSSPTPEKLMGLDLYFLAESMTSPPILHILTSRSKEEVKLSSDSALILTSNTLFYLFRAYVLDRLLRYCVFITNTQWQLIYWDSNVFFLWPIFFSSVNLDSVLTIPFCILIFVVDYFTFVSSVLFLVLFASNGRGKSSTITHQFLIEVITCEWKFSRRWQAVIILCILVNIPSKRMASIISWLILNAIRAATCTELMLIIVLYPLSRLLEDITFHHGVPASFVAVLGLRVVFLFYVGKFAYWYCYHGMILPIEWRNGIIVATSLLFLIAFIIKSCDIVILKKKNWKLIFVPTTNWGQFDLSLRLLRKKFDSSKYIASQAPRDLSRYLIQKAEPKSYKLDLRYELPRKSMLYLRATNYKIN